MRNGWMPSKLLTRTMMAITAAVLLVIGVASAVVIGGDGDAGLAGRGAPTVASEKDDTGEAAVPSAGSSSPSPTGGGPSSEVGGDAGSAPAEAQDGGGDDPADLRPRRATAPQAGTYIYEWSQRGAEEERGTYEVVITDGENGDDGHRQFIRRGGEEESNTDEVEWRGDGMHILATTFGAGGQVECDWEPDYRSLATPLKAGATWSYETSCTVSAGDSSATIEQTGEFTVVEQTRIDVAGEAVDVWKIKGIEDTVSPSYGQRRNTTAFFSPAHGLMVKTTTSTAATAPWQSAAAVAETEIQNLSPQ